MILRQRDKSHVLALIKYIKHVENSIECGLEIPESQITD